MLPKKKKEKMSLTIQKSIMLMLLMQMKLPQMPKWMKSKPILIYKAKCADLENQQANPVTRRVGK